MEKRNRICPTYANDKINDGREDSNADIIRYERGFRILIKSNSCLYVHRKNKKEGGVKKKTIGIIIIHARLYVIVHIYANVQQHFSKTIYSLHVKRTYFFRQFLFSKYANLLLNPSVGITKNI